MDSLGEIITLVKVPADASQSHLKIQVMEAQISPFTAILSFHSTCVMNLIAFDCAYSLYPIATFGTRETLLTRENVDSTLVSKYRRRGWKPQWPNLLAYSASSRGDEWSPETVRSLLDSHTWRVPLDVTGVEPRAPPSPKSPSMSWDPVVANSWKFTMTISSHNFSNLWTHCYCSVVIQSTAFRYNYVTADHKVSAQLYTSAHDLQSASAVSEWRGPHAVLRLPKPAEEWEWLDADFPVQCRDAAERVSSSSQPSPLVEIMDSLVPEGSRRLRSDSVTSTSTSAILTSNPIHRPPQQDVARALPRLRGLFR
ncbi:hypothetical protein CONPUDRAFT_146097 [Coniophora puteana RWD-64-598 SS2]|uniref:Uncharacterized protein n=1 Tax=Coniophora puteana (strain RWD-64-598) TaxID=741705 RepID=A0A5M3MFP8_CONPW|nr:uncharacterized protein CONPUDRAFT_146097 [Coniophora puteana RWD-64-598 SS2]EIW78042.1 hypothetical protein CONPUDRAFT_146097 [Coniophora puteana RWD-64-598 SS2]